jgi:hypothetical protein
MNPDTRHPTPDGGALPAAKVHSPLHPNLPASPPAIWTAFARVSAWKSWVLILEFLVIALLGVTVVTLAGREPDVVTIGPDGASTYVSRSVAGAALLRFLAEQKGQVPDVAVVHFTRDFLTHFLGTNSSTIRASFPAALAMMNTSLSARYQHEADAKKLVESVEHSGVRTDLAIEDVTLVERAADLLHVRARVARVKSRLSDGSDPWSDALDVDLVEKGARRSAAHPDGLQIVDVQVRASNGAPRN